MKAKSSSSRRGLLAGGNWTVDRVKWVGRFPLPEHTAAIRSQGSRNTGSPHNILVALAQSGAAFPLLAAGLVGNDAPGADLLADCKKHRVDIRHLGTSPKAGTACTDVMTEQAGGRRLCFHSSGANALWTGADLDFARLKVRHFHLGSLLLLDALDAADAKFGTRAARLLASATAAGVKTSVDIAGGDTERMAGIIQPALKFSDYLIISEAEAGRLTGFKVREPDGRLDTVTLRHAAGALLQQGVRDLVVLHFPEGAFARTRKGDDVWQSAVKLPARLVAGAADAGDAFCAGFLLGLHEGWETPRCLEAGVCLAAASLSGGIKSLNTSLALGKKHRFHPRLDRADGF